MDILTLLPRCTARRTFQSQIIDKKLSKTCRRSLTTTRVLQNATPLAYPNIPGPAPSPPVSQLSNPIARERIKEKLASSGNGSSGVSQRKFWKEVHVREVKEGLQVHLDNRPVRTLLKPPSPLTLPSHKKLLATGIALEWTHLANSQQALKQEYIPLTCLVSRALHLSTCEAKIRADVVNLIMKYLSTDTLLCWNDEGAIESEVRDEQVVVAGRIVEYLIKNVYPGVEIVPVLEKGVIMPREQPAATKEAIRKWMEGLDPWDLAGLERAVLASKSFMVACRLIVEWSRHFNNSSIKGVGKEEGERFGIKEATHASSIEVNWQIKHWGEVEDTHDVDRVDLARQLGSVILLVS